jgi:anti-anti-sigma regulatory factor
VHKLSVVVQLGVDEPKARIRVFGRFTVVNWQALVPLVERCRRTAWTDVTIDLTGTDQVDSLAVEALLKHDAVMQSVGDSALPLSIVRAPVAAAAA